MALEAIGSDDRIDLFTKPCGLLRRPRGRLRPSVVGSPEPDQREKREKSTSDPRAPRDTPLIPYHARLHSSTRKKSVKSSRCSPGPAMAPASPASYDRRDDNGDAAPLPARDAAAHGNSRSRSAPGEALRSPRSPPNISRSAKTRAVPDPAFTIPPYRGERAAAARPEQA